MGHRGHHDVRPGHRVTERDMDDPGGSGSSLQGAAMNASWTEDAGSGASGRLQLLLEVLVVLMCVGAVTGTQPV